MSEYTLHTPSIKRLERPQQRVVAGVCTGLGRYFDLNPAVFRLGFVVLTILGGAGILVYVAAILVIPKEGEDRSIAEDILAKRRDHPGRLVALGLIAVAILSLLARASTWPAAGTAWLLVIAGGLALMWTSRRGIAAAILAVLALAAIAVVAAIITAFAWFDVSLGDGIGNHTYTPTTLTGDHYKLGVGKLTLDLTQVPAGAHVRASVGIGEIHVLLPAAAAATVATHVKAGSIDALGQHDDGTSAHLVVGSGQQITVDAKVGGGHIEVERAP